MRVEGGRTTYGEVLGVLLLDTRFPRIPGDVGNASSYRFPVRFKVVRGATVRRVVVEADKSLLGPFLKAARELEAEGVRAVTTSCGFLVLFQDELARALRIPVFTSSLLMIPLVYRLTMGRVGILTANSKSLTRRHLEAAGVDLERVPVAIAGLEDKEEFSRVILGDAADMNVEKVEKEVVEACEELLARHDDIKALVFECHNLSPYSRAVQERLKIPIFDFIAFAHFVYEAVVKRRFKGIL